MDNHYRLVVRTPEPNLSHAIRWLNVGSNLSRAGWRWEPSRRVVGGRSRGQRREALRTYTEGPVRQGRLDRPWAGLVGGLVLGGTDFAKRLLKGRRVDAAEQTPGRRLGRAGRMDWPQIVRAAEQVSGGSWQQMQDRHGDWGRDGTMYVAVRYGGYRLAEVVRALAGLKYQAAAQAVRRFQAGLGKDAEKTRFVDKLKERLAKSPAKA
jgi:hypothetical protein